jgi:hypothetical protein
VEEIMTKLGLGIIVAIGLTLPAKASELELIKMPDGIYVLNAAKSVVRGGGPAAEMFKVEKDKTTVIGWNVAGQLVNFVFPDPVIDGQSHPITGSPLYDSYVGRVLDPYTVATTRYKDGEARLTTVSMFNPKTNTYTTTAISLRGTAINLLVYEKQ